MSNTDVDWQEKALEYAGKLKDLVKVIKEEREANRKVRAASARRGRREKNAGRRCVRVRARRVLCGAPS